MRTRRRMDGCLLPDATESRGQEEEERKVIRVETRGEIHRSRGEALLFPENETFMDMESYVRGATVSAVSVLLRAAAIPSGNEHTHTYVGGARFRRNRTGSRNGREAHLHALPHYSRHVTGGGAVESSSI